MPGDPRALARADLPEQLTAETIRRLPLSVLRRLSRPGNGVLGAEEQVSFDAALHEVMSDAAGRVSRQINTSDWATVRRDLESRGSRGRRPGRPSGVDEQLRRAARRIDRQVGVAEALAPGVDWSFAEPGVPAHTEPPGTTDAEHSGDREAETVSDLEEHLTEQVGLIQIMSEIADVGRRTYALEQQRDLQTTRGVFFGFVVSAAVLVAGWALWSRPRTGPSASGSCASPWAPASSRAWSMHWSGRGRSASSLTPTTKMRPPDRG